MSLLRRTRPADTVEQTPESDPSPPPAAATDEDVAQPAVTSPVPRTRTGAAWVGVCAAAVIAVALIVFMVQNTRSVEISFLWMAASTSLAVALLIAAVGGILLTLVVGTARITQLRRVVRRNRR
jgi:putative membrane protein